MASSKVARTERQKVDNLGIEMAEPKALGKAAQSAAQLVY